MKFTHVDYFELTDQSYIDAKVASSKSWIARIEAEIAIKLEKNPYYKQEQEDYWGSATEDYGHLIQGQLDPLKRKGGGHGHTA